MEIDLNNVNDVTLRKLQQFVEKARKQLIKKAVDDASSVEDIYARLSKASSMRLKEIDSELGVLNEPEKVIEDDPFADDAGLVSGALPSSCCEEQVRTESERSMVLAGRH